MIINLSIKPTSVFLILVYFLLLFLLFSIPSDFITVWVIMEISSLVFLCFILSISSRVGYTSNILYFILQACFSINILVIFISENSSGSLSILTTLFILANVGAAPINILYFYSFNILDIFLLFIALSPQKIFPVLLLISHHPSSSILLVFIFIILSSLIIIFLSTSINPLRDILVTSSIFNSSWIVLTSLVGYSIFFIYLLVYSFFLYLILFNNQLFIPIITLIGLPPFPLFFVKLSTVYYLIATTESILLITLTLFTLFVTSLSILSIYFSVVSNHSANS